MYEVVDTNRQNKTDERLFFHHRPFGFGFGRPYFGRPFGFGFGAPFLGGVLGGLLASELLYPPYGYGYGYGYPFYSYPPYYY